MMANDWQRLNIWLKLNNRFDYAEYSAACMAENVEPQNALEFSQKAGMVSAGISAHPELPENEAYLKFISDNQQVYVPSAVPQQQPPVQVPPQMQEVEVQFPDGRIEKRMVPLSQSTTGCSTCGGGKVL